jgi:hypothetical protein
MDNPRISVKPIVTLAGEHEVNQVFFDGPARRSPTGWARRTRAGPWPSTC